MKYLAVKNYEQFQHYRDRAPVWIKLYNAVMDDEAFLELSDAERGQLMLIWLLASRRENKIPNDPKHVARAIQASGRVNLERFVEAGFLLPYQSASDVLAEPEQPASKTLAKPENGASPHARPRARGEGEKRREEKEPTLDAGASGAAEPPPSKPAVAVTNGSRPKREPAPWMGRLNATWKAAYGGNLPDGSATLLTPVVKELGEEEADRRLAIYCEQTKAAFASIRSFVPKHGAFTKSSVNVKDGWFAEAG